MASSYNCGTMQKIVILGGGTVNHVRNHLAICAPAYGGTAKALATLVGEELRAQGLTERFEVQAMLTEMADSSSRIATNADVAALVDSLVADPTVKAVIFNVALADFEGSIEGVASGKYAERLRTKNG